MFGRIIELAPSFSIKEQGNFGSALKPVKGLDIVGLSAGPGSKQDKVYLFYLILKKKKAWRVWSTQLAEKSDVESGTHRSWIFAQILL